MKKLRIVLIAVIVICAGVLAWYFYQDKEQLEQVEEMKEKVIEEDPKEEGRKIDFEALWEENEDVIAWIEIPGTDVDYPILQSAEDEAEDYYLNHNFDRSSGYPGAIYIQKRNKKDFKDPLSVIYGHNMKNGSMFGSLHKIYMDQTSFDETNEMIIYTPEETYHYQVFASCIYDDRLILDYYNDFTDNASFTSYINEIESLADANGVKDEDIDVQADDEVIVLSTCVSVDTQRFLVHAVKIKDDES